MKRPEVTGTGKACYILVVCYNNVETLSLYCTKLETGLAQEEVEMQQLPMVPGQCGQDPASAPGDVNISNYILHQHQVMLIYPIRSFPSTRRCCYIRLDPPSI